MCMSFGNDPSRFEYTREDVRDDTVSEIEYFIQELRNDMQKEISELQSDLAIQRQKAKRFRIKTWIWRSVAFLLSIVGLVDKFII